MPALTVIDGYVGLDPVFKPINENGGFLSFRVSTKRAHAVKDAAGNWNRETDWFSVETWQKADSWLTENLKKGSPVMVTGHFENRKYDDKDGNTKYFTSVRAENVRIWSPSPATADAAPAADATPGEDGGMPF